MPPVDGRIRILLADEQSLFREAVKAVLESEPDLRVVAEARDGLQAVGEAERTRPDVAVLEAGLPNGDGVRTASLIKARVPECRILVLSETEDQRILIEALEVGATGYLTKESPLQDLIDATRAIHRGETLVPGQMLGPLLAQLVRRRREQDDAIRRASRLTRREREVLALLADGAGNGSIAQSLVISPETARTHITNLLQKLEFHSRLEAAAFVRTNGIRQELVDARR